MRSEKPKATITVLTIAEVRHLFAKFPDAQNPQSSQIGQIRTLAAIVQGSLGSGLAGQASRRAGERERHGRGRGH